MADPVAEHTNDDSLRQPEPDGRRQPQLVVALECDRPLAGSARFSLAGVDEVLLGRGGRREAIREVHQGYTTLRLRLPARSMSSTHARLVRAQGKWIVEDAGSRNGSFVNGQRVVRAVVSEGDVAEVGHALLFMRDRMNMGDAPSDLDGAELPIEEHGFRTLVPQIAEELAALKRLAPTRVPFLLLGETGTGKEAIARRLHALSGRTGAMVSINCGALPASLVEAQLFGHLKGAFSGAIRDESGFVRSAHEGTLFLDEIGDLTRSSQTALLRFLQEGEVIPVGSTRVTKVDVRVVSATHQSLTGNDAVFRADLFARLAGRTLRMPPLRERMEDFGLAVAHLLAAHAAGGGEGITLSPELGRAFLQHRWPLNFRELKQAICAALPLTDDGVLRCKHFPGLAPTEGPRSTIHPDAGRVDARPWRSEDERLRVVVVAHLREHRGNVTAVARAMGKAPMQIHRWMKRFGIEPSRFRRADDG